MAQEQLLPLALLYVDRSKEIDGATKFQKLVFLAQEEEKGMGKPFDFRSDKYGPFSPELYATLEELERRGLIEKEVRQNRSGKEKHNFRLTAEGRNVVQRLREESEAFEQVLERADSLKRKYNSMPLDRLLKYVYTNYEKYTDKSKLDEFKPA